MHYEELDDHIDENPLTMPALDFIAWLSSKDINFAGKPPRSPIKRASLLFEMALADKISADEIGRYLAEIGLMTPLKEN